MENIKINVIPYVCIALQTDFSLGAYIPVQHIVGKLRMRRVQWCLPTELGVGSLGRRLNRSFKSELVLLPFLTKSEA